MTALLRFGGLSAALAGALAAQGPASGGYSFEQASATLATYCGGCHAGEKALGGFNLARFPDVESIRAHPQKWEAAFELVRDSGMPPPGASEPPIEARERLSAWIEATLREAACSEGPQPGANPVRRLNRSEYAAAVRDLLNVHFNAGAGLPADGAGGEGFDNAAETLFLSPVHAEKYLEAAKEALGYAASDPRSRRRFLIAEPDPATTPEAAARRILEAFLPRAFRRPVADHEVDRYLALFRRSIKEGEDFERSVLYALEGVLISPHFLFRIEAPNLGPEPVPISDFELASRLSFFLWGSMPDEDLFSAARSGLLHDPGVLEEMILCMLESEKTREFSERFVEQWLGTRELGRNIEPDPEIFPEYHQSEIRAAIRYEPILFFDVILKEGLSLLNLLDSDFSVMNRKLMRHYGLEPPKGLRESPLKVKLPPDSRRGGVLSMAAILAVSSYPRRTSPVLRGKWVLENLLGSPPPPPPPNVPELEEAREGEPPKSVRERLERHRADAICASCHDRIDPIGFGLEPYDVLGRWRDEDAGQPIDARGVLPDGSEFDGPEELKRVLLDRKDRLMRNLTAKLLSYALGRGLTIEDYCAVDDIVAKLAKSDYNAHTLIIEIAKSVPFRYKRPTTTERASN